MYILTANDNSKTVIYDQSTKTKILDITDSFKNTHTGSVVGDYTRFNWNPSYSDLNLIFVGHYETKFSDLVLKWTSVLAATPASTTNVNVWDSAISDDDLLGGKDYYSIQIHSNDEEESFHVRLTVKDSYQKP